jgi:uncharacterized protein (TIGR02453 family)
MPNLDGMHIAEQHLHYMMDFLKDLEQNNHRDWMHTQEKRYKTARSYFIGLIEQLLPRMQSMDIQLANLQAKDCMYRQARDIRFSKDKTPYKTHFSLALAQGGKNSGKAVYYFQFGPGETFLGGGVYMPPSPILKRIREEIDYCTEEWVQILAAPDFKTLFDDLDDVRMRSMPKGYEKEHPMASYLRLKSFTASTTMRPDELLSPTILPRVLESFQALIPFIHFLNRSLDQE